MPFFPSVNLIGNVLGYADETGAVTAAYDYDAYGNLLDSTGPLAAIFRHRFSTKLFDPDIGLCCYGCRWYSPALGRWLSRDPIEEEGGENLYGFCGNSPLFDFDPIGKAYFAYRPLESTIGRFVGVFGTNTLDRGNIVVAHEQLFFEDGKKPSNLGFFNDRSVRADSETSTYMPPHSTGWDDCIMREAVKQVVVPPYSLLGGINGEKFNCQDWAEEVRMAYFAILRNGHYKSPRVPSFHGSK
ncbi:MAG: RHS repeat-associated core domain-containing protein [Bacteroidales bacterium]|nr:RHS repeat-associated core domain-containing protein [Bacteroidales bacterium]